MIYFDNAATGWPKPPDVFKEMELTMRFRGGNPSRGGHPLSMVAGKVIYRCRETLAAHFGSVPERVIFTPGATYSINIAMKSIIGKGDHFIISNIEHNAVLRAAYALSENGATYDTFDGLATDDQIMADISSKIKKNTVAIVCLHASNVMPLRLPIEKIGKICQKHRIMFILDGAQSAGHTPIHIERQGIDALCLPGHKGLLGPQGCGCLILSPRMQARMENGCTLIEGGTGIRSEEFTMPKQLPERFEAGTQPTALIAGLNAGVKFIEKIGYDEIISRENTVYRILREGLLDMSGVQLYYPQATEGNIILFNLTDIKTEKVGLWFDREGVCLRSGFHCAPMAHRRLGTGDGGAVRLGIGWNNTAREAFSFLAILHRAQKELRLG